MRDVSQQVADLVGQIQHTATCSEDAAGHGICELQASLGDMHHSGMFYLGEDDEENQAALASLVAHINAWYTDRLTRILMGYEFTPGSPLHDMKIIGLPVKAPAN